MIFAFNDDLTAVLDLFQHGMKIARKFGLGDSHSHPFIIAGLARSYRCAMRSVSDFRYRGPILKFHAAFFLVQCFSASF